MGIFIVVLVVAAFLLFLVKRLFAYNNIYNDNKANLDIRYSMGELTANEYTEAGWKIEGAKCSLALKSI